MILFRLKAAHFRKAPSSQDCFRPNWQEISIYLLPLNIHVPDDDSPVCTTGDELPSVVGIGERLNFITEKETRQLAINHLWLLHKWAQNINKAVQTIWLPICFPLPLIASIRCKSVFAVRLGPEWECCSSGQHPQKQRPVLITVFAAPGIGSPSCTGKPQQGCTSEGTSGCINKALVRYLLVRMSVTILFCKSLQHLEMNHWETTQDFLLTLKA